MSSDNKARIGFAITGSFCTLRAVLEQLAALVAEDYDVTCILSYNASTLDTRFYSADVLIDDVERITGHPALLTLPQAEPIGPKALFDLLVVAPCTGNTLAKLALGITDTPVTLAAKAHLRNARPILIAISTNDALSTNAKNIGLLLNTRNYFFVPFAPDDPGGKPASLIAKLELLPKCVTLALNGIQMLPVSR